MACAILRNARSTVGETEDKMKLLIVLVLLVSLATFYTSLSRGRHLFSSPVLYHAKVDFCHLIKIFGLFITVYLKNVRLNFSKGMGYQRSI